MFHHQLCICIRQLFNNSFVIGDLRFELTLELFHFFQLRQIFCQLVQS